MHNKRVFAWRALAPAATLTLAACSETGQALNGYLNDVNFSREDDHGHENRYPGLRCSGQQHRPPGGCSAECKKTPSVTVVRTTVFNGIAVNVQNNQATIRRDDGHEVFVVRSLSRTTVKKHGNQAENYDDVDVYVHAKVVVN